MMLLFFDCDICVWLFVRVKKNDRRRVMSQKASVTHENDFFFLTHIPRTTDSVSQTYIYLGHVYVVVCVRVSPIILI